jgi:opacity protein-like surface antigen
MHHRLLTSQRLRVAMSVVATALAAAAASPALAQEKSLPVVDRVGVWLGGYKVDAEGDLTLGTADGSQTTGEQRVIDGSDVVKRARVDWLLFDQQGFSVDLFQFSQNKTTGVTRPFTFNGQAYSASALLNTDTKVDIGNFSYRWWFGGEDTVAGVGVGAAFYKIKLNYSASASLGGLSQSIADGTEESAVAPLVTLGLRHRISDQVRLYADLSGSRKNGGDTNGDIVNVGAGIEWFPWRNVGVGAEYNHTRIRVNYREDDAVAKLNLRLNGPALYLRMRF